MSAQNTLQWQDRIRGKPGMYIGGRDERALSTCVTELIANALEEHLAGHGNSVTVSMHDDGSLSVKDAGGGISVELDPAFNVSVLELIMTAVHGWNHYSGTGRHYLLGLNGLGLKCVNAVFGAALRRRNQG